MVTYPKYDYWKYDLKTILKCEKKELTGMTQNYAAGTAGMLSEHVCAEVETQQHSQLEQLIKNRIFEFIPKPSRSLYFMQI